jgi:hypothetical protein
MENPMTLEDQIKKHSRDVQTESYSMSVSELISMYKDGELELHPAFQRFFRWTPEQKSRLIESLLLGIPIPAIFVSEREDSKWDVIDGLQRISSILEVVGELKDENGHDREMLQLTKTNYLPDLEGRFWEHEDDDKVLPSSARIKIKRARLDINIVRSTSDGDVKYEVFQRLNAGGSAASHQEIRNCLLVMADVSYYEWLSQLAKLSPFQDTLSLSDKAIEEAYEVELACRLLIFAEKTPEELQQIVELSSYLNKEALKLASDSIQRRGLVASHFRSTFEFLAELFGENSFKRYDSVKGRYLGPMLVSIYEVVAGGLLYHLLNGGELPDKGDFTERHKNLWASLSSNAFVGSGVRASTRIPETSKFGRNWIQQ